MSENGLKRTVRDEAGFSVIDILIVVSIVGIVASFSLVQTARARKNLTRANEARKFAAYVEGCRLDSVRRRATTIDQMARVTIVNASSYSVLMDSDGDGVTDLKVVSLPLDAGLTFNAPFPRAVYFNWRGRTVDDSGNATVASPVAIKNTYGTNVINITGAGEPSIDTALTPTTVANSSAPASALRSQTTIP